MALKLFKMNKLYRFQAPKCHLRENKLFLRANENLLSWEYHTKDKHRQ